jgi:hydrogenase maturation factor HypE
MAQNLGFFCNLKKTARSKPSGHPVKAQNENNIGSRYKRQFFISEKCGEIAENCDLKNPDSCEDDSGYRRLEARFFKK